ncbi:LLM class F420-dependent oxidoreductase [Pseudonocardia sulfidoxydans NBRC 16205]|uniref:LLM class F420-dependent oxidoreductase n=2 Tax=Pseudonocardia sulfidoxydans TaxID=54011 RepID=A0A511D8S1_9PSEU|nr:LLM class F420-dependent oxidoreductase [Pseudonocardia sulfidoxydans NBRC 16205]
MGPVKVRIGIGLGQGDIGSDDLAEVMAAIDTHDLDSLWMSEILTSPGPDPLVALASAAHLHPSLRLGATIVLPGRNPVRLAKALATLDRLSGGRLLLTFVPGLPRGVESAAVGVPVADRGAVMDAVLPKLRRWWAGEEVDGVRVLPRPVQDPLEPWLAGLAPASLRRCGRFADGWLGAFCTVDEAVAARDAINAAADAAGREIDPEHFGMSIGYAVTPPDDAQLAAIAARTRGREIDPADVVPVGPAEVRRLLERFIEQGFSKFVLRPTRPSAAGWDTELGSLAAEVGRLQT